MTDAHGQGALIQLSRALSAARAAAAAIAHVGDPQAFSKGGAGPATVADLASQVAASIVLHDHCGSGIRLVAEEGWSEVQKHGATQLVEPVCHAVRAAGLECSAQRCQEMLQAGQDSGGSGAFWAIDPLDGTKGYLRGGQFAVAIALVVHGQPEVGVLAAPRLGLKGTGAGQGVAFAAVHGCGAWQAALEGGSPRSIRCGTWDAGRPIRVAGSVEAAHSSADAVERAVAGVGSMTPIQMDSQAKYGLVARGCADAYIRQSPSAGYVEHLWDHAAGALVAQEAGCVVTDLRGQALDFACGRGLSSNMGVLCAVPGLHAPLASAFAKALG